MVYGFFFKTMEERDKMYNQQMFDYCIDTNEIIPKLKRWKGEMYINEVNMFPNGYKLVLSFRVNCEQPNGLVHQSNINNGISTQGNRTLDNPFIGFEGAISIWVPLSLA